MKKFIKFLVLCLVSAVSIGCLTACGKPESENPPESTPKKDFEGIIFEDDTVYYDTKEHKIEATGYPEGATVTYTNAGPHIQAGEYQITVKITAENYNDYEKTVTLTIISVLDYAKDALDKVLNRPDVWSFMPECFKKEEMATSTDPVKDFASNFVAVNTINKRFIGKQAYVLWEGVYDLATILKCFDTVNAASTSIADVYQTFINDNPTNYSNWQGEAAGFKLKITLTENTVQLLAGNSNFSIELNANTQTGINEGRIQLANNAVAKYETSENKLKFNVSLSIAGVANMKQVEFVKTNGIVSGHFYEYTGAKEVALKTSAVFNFDSQYASIMSAKREGDDLLVNGFEEVYDVSTGEFISGEVEETVKIVDYDTHWVNIYDVTGITSVKAVKNDANVDPTKNQYDVYLNGVNEIFTPEYNKIVLVKTSRHFDIEMRDVYYVVEISNGDDIDYEVVKTQIPMLFVQEENISDFTEEAKDNNKNAFATNPVLPLENISLAQSNFAQLKAKLDALKEQVTYDEMVGALGERNQFFN